MEQDQAQFDECPPQLTWPTDLTSPARDALKWFDVHKFAKQYPGKVVLCRGGLRPANPEADATSQDVRAALLYAIASASLGQIAFSRAMKRVRFWPEDDDTGSMSLVAASIVKDWLDLIHRFRVEDVESLDCLLACCATELVHRPADRFTDATKAWLPRYLLKARSAAMDVLVSRGQVTHALRLQMAPAPHLFAETLGVLT
jgi:hypothetical protein